MDYLQVVIVTRICHRLPPLEALFAWLRPFSAGNSTSSTLSWMLVGRLTAVMIHYTDTELLWYRAFPSLVSTLNKCRGRTCSKSNGIVRITMNWGLLSAVGEEQVGIVIVVVVVGNHTGNPEGGSVDVDYIIIILQLNCYCYW